MAITKFFLVIDNSFIIDGGAAAIELKVWFLILQQALWEAIRSEMEKPIEFQV